MFTLNIKLSNVEDVNEFKRLISKYDNKVSMLIGGRVVAKPLITCSPYITPLDDITVSFNSESINEFMDMIRDLDQYVAKEQIPYTRQVVNKVHEMMEASE